MAVLFSLTNLMVLPFWGLMIVLPQWRWTARVMRSPFVSLAPALFYAGLVLPRLGEIWPAVSRPSLSGVASLLGSPEGAVIAWVHFLAFDLFVGRWIYLDSQERRLPIWLTAPVLFLTLMLGPLGFVSYLVIRATARPAAAGKGSASVPRGSNAERQSFAGAAQPKSALGERWGNLLGRMLSMSRPLTILGGAMLLVLLATLAGLVLDHRVIIGAPAWLKPAKFAISISVYSFTFVWLLRFVENHPRLARLAANVTVISFIVEMTAIMTQAARGT